MFSSSVRVLTSKRSVSSSPEPKRVRSIGTQTDGTHDMTVSHLSTAVERLTSILNQDAYHTPPLGHGDSEYTDTHRTTPQRSIRPASSLHPTVADVARSGLSRQVLSPTPPPAPPAPPAPPTPPAPPAPLVTKSQRCTPSTTTSSVPVTVTMDDVLAELTAKIKARKQGSDTPKIM